MQHIDPNVYYYYLDELEKCGHISEFEKQAMLAQLGQLGGQVATKFPNFTKAMTQLGVNAGHMSPGMAIGDAVTTAALPTIQKGLTNIANRVGRQTVSLSKKPGELAAHAVKNQRRSAAGNSLQFFSDKVLPVAAQVF